ncbi:branched-subunit amino acid transport protein [Scopulibacillus daqui]|uniref:Branched-subunit amino acid transport protein n=1 Tax=Scopulibacillus daqui TaxID=1469162 RepID=A0ABS2Q3A6_9BACL|nr:AzlD domain-containing protein [Scopulibacillus daqui]MBM7646775.1 branched-subunit amino acid transport protein [Scopulibacillus daqui]
MSIDLSMILLILGCTMVTVIPRILPFVVVRNVQLPEPVLKWLSYVPICILTALVTESFIHQTNGFPKFEWPVFTAIIPTFLTAVWTKSLTATVIFGVIVMALLRLFI